jgi:hypothetical protein
LFMSKVGSLLKYSLGFGISLSKCRGPFLHLCAAA